MQKGPIRILLVEDNRGDAALVRHYLSRELKDFQLEHVELVEAAVRRLGKSPSRDNPSIDLILLDMHLPDSGPDATFARVHEAAPQIPIVVLTGIADREKAEEAVREGAQDYLVKGEVDPKVLVRSIRYAIERTHWSKQLRESEERYALAVRGANDGLWDWQLESNQIFFSPRWNEMLGIPAEAKPRGPEFWFSRVHSEDRDTLRDAIEQHLLGRTPYFRSEHRLQHSRGHYLWVLSRGLAVRDSQGKAYRMAGSISDISDRKRFEEQLLRDAFYDSLTGLPNRALFVDRLSLSISRTRRHPDYQYAVLFLDLDRFKNINDSLGHLLGDELLRRVADRLQPLVRQGDTVARLGGDEFAILLDDISDSSRASIVADRILRELGIPFQLDKVEVYSTASIGISLSTTGYSRAEEVLRDADTAMYRAKSRGKAQYAVFDREMHARAVALLKMENDLRRALEREELRLHYQPIVNLASGRIRGFEALLRWHHPIRGLILPDEFIPIAEETGMIVQIGHFVLTEACHQVSEWQEHFPEHGPLSVSVNLSSKEFLQPDLVEQVARVLKKTGLTPESLDLEITESIIMQHHDPVQAKLHDLRELEVGLHIDDFGTGYSSLNYLHQLPATALKIDRSFVRQLFGGGRPEIVGTIVYLAHNLGLDVAAEGLETEDEFRHLREMNCHYGQGFYFSRPVDQTAATQMLAANRHW